jgi:DNA/RNA-binding domain of Phe-tRNA-synthetase-like protein
VTGVDGPDELSREGWVDRDLLDEFPELRIFTVETEAPPKKSPQALRNQLRTLSSRFNGASAITMRRQPIPHAYRVFFRHIGLDPDTTRTPIEAVAMDRLMRGGFESRSWLEDAMLLALVETGVPVWALDADRIDGPLGIRPSRTGEQLGGGELAADLPEGRLVVADAEGPVGVLFGDLAHDRAPTADTTLLRVFTVQVAGVPAIHVEEALWACANALTNRS